jgi:hypothetical protein
LNFNIGPSSSTTSSSVGEGGEKAEQIKSSPPPPPKKQKVLDKNCTTLNLERTLVSSPPEIE